MIGGASPAALASLALRVIAANRACRRTIATAESCTGGLVSAALTDVPGSSAVLDRGFVTYSNEAKQEMLDVPAAVIAASGAVSVATASAMARGALAHSQADVAVSITGIAGPDGGSAEKPVGTVVFGLARRNEEAVHTETRHFDGPDRAAIRAQATLVALELLLP